MAESRCARSLALVLVLVTGVSTAAIVATYSKLSHTWDEATHVFAGLEWLQDGQYTFQTENPPLGRVPLAIIPFLSGARVPPSDEWVRGQSFVVETVFYRSPGYVRNVTEARVVTLILFWAAIALTWRVAGGRADPWVAFLSAAMVATLPPIVAHAGFATTDVPFVVTFLLALVALRRLLAAPSPGALLAAGAAIGIAVATKFSALAFLPPVVGAIVMTHVRGRRAAAMPVFQRFGRWRGLTVIAGTAALVIWSAYRFNAGRLADLPQGFGPYGSMPTSGWTALVRDWPLPGHELLHGLLFMRAHVEAGHRVVFLDQFSQSGFLLFFPVLLATKTPIPSLVLWGAGLIGLCRRRVGDHWRWPSGLALGALGILVVAMTGSINLGVRHVLVIYPLVAVASAWSVVRLAERTARRRWVLGAAVGLVGLQLVLLLWSVPNQITYFNVFAGSSPGYVASDSDLDWGQDALALEDYFAEHPVPALYVLLSGTTKTCTLRLPPLRALPDHPVPGWIAVSESAYRMNRGVIRENPCELPGDPGPTFTAEPGWLDWLRPYEPVDIIGRTIRLYHIPETR